jgi:PKD repeat protein
VTFTASGGTTYEFFLNGISVQGPTSSSSYTTDLLADGDEVYVTLMDAAGCSAISAAIITRVNPVPEVTIEEIPDALCVDALPFTITGVPTSANGSFSSDLPSGLVDNGDGTAIVDPSLIPPGTPFTINYSYTSEDGCEASASTEIEVNALPDAGFTGLVATYFTNDPLVLITPNEIGGVFSTSSGVVLIDNGDGSVTLDPNQTPIGGPYDVTYTLTDANGCTNEQVQVFSILFVTEVSFSGLEPTYCEVMGITRLVGLPADENGTFSATVPDGALIDNGDGTAVLILAGLEVNTVFELTYTYSDAGQTIETTQSFQVLAVPFIDLPATLTICGETSISVGAENEGNSILWSTGATTPELRVAEAGTYTVQVTTPEGCTAAASTEVSVQPGIELVTNFLVADEVCIGERLQFIDVSSVLDGVVSYFWDFGDGNTSTERDPIHAYGRDGVFEVTLTAEVEGCDVIIVAKPVLIVNCGRGSGASVFGGISIFPNPSPGNFQIDVNLRRQEIVKITVVDVYGKIIAVRNSADRFSHSFYFADMKTGVYYVIVQSYGQREIKQVVVIEGY